MDNSGVHESFFKSLHSPALVLDAHGRVLDANRAFVQHFGSWQAGQAFDHGLDERGIAAVASILAALGDGPERWVYRFQREGQPECIWSWLWWKEGAVFCGLAEPAATNASSHGYPESSEVDVLRSQLAELQHSNRELEQFSLSLAHDLQQPLRTAASFLHLLQRQCADSLSLDAQEMLQHAVEGTGRMQQMIRDLLEYARMRAEPSDWVKVNLNELLEEVSSNLQQVLDDRGAQVFCEQLPEVRASRAHVQQLFQNLIENAIKFRSPARAPEIVITASEEDHTWCFSISDNGMGIAESEREAIFQLFHRLSDQTEPGSGVGLSLCRKIVEQHGGRIWVESTPGQGSSFYFTLPQQV
jgi:signal transduction histidine kinase